MTTLIIICFEYGSKSKVVRASHQAGRHGAFFVSKVVFDPGPRLQSSATGKEESASVPFIFAPFQNKKMKTNLSYLYQQCNFRKSFKLLIFKRMLGEDIHTLFGEKGWKTPEFSTVANYVKFWNMTNS